MDEFKSHMTIVQTLGNPGLKARHWERISEIVGFPIVVDDEMTLERVSSFFSLIYFTYKSLKFNI